MSDELKLPLIQSLNRLAMAKAADAIQLTGRALPCTVAAIQSSGIVTVNFEVNAAPFTLPQVTVPLGYAEYLRYPIKFGDAGWVAPAAAHLGGITGLGTGIPALSAQPANLSALVFYWLGNTKWSPADDPQALIGYGPSGTIHRDTNSLAVHTVTPMGITAESPAFNATGNGSVGSGATGSFTTPTGQTVTVISGVIVNIF